MLEKLESLKENLIKPITGNDPYGEDPKYEEDFEWLKEEVAKMGGIGAGAPDWSLIEARCLKLLSEKAKDLNLMAYLITAWTILYKLEGLVVGMEILAEFLGEPWPDIFPKPLPKKRKARSLSLIWLQNQLNERVDSCESAGRPLLERGLAALVLCKDAICEHFEDPPANFKLIRTNLEDWLAVVADSEDFDGNPVEVPEPVTQQLPLTTEVTPPSQPEATRSAVKTDTPVEIPKLAEDADLDAIYGALGQIGSQIRTQNPLIPLPYLLSRMSLWEGAGLPRHDETKTTHFPAPASELVDSLVRMNAKAAWEPLISKAEDFFNERWFWLDLQYYAAQAARGLGADEVVTIIEDRCRQLDQLLPQLKELKFNDGRPFAMTATLDWLVQLGQPSAAERAEPDPAQVLLSEMRGLGVTQFSEAMELAQDAMRACTDGRSEFRLRLEAAQFCIEAAQFYWAESLAESLLDQCENHDLARWDPELAGRAWGILLVVARELRESDPAYPALERRAMKALAGLDVARAGKFPKSRPG